MGKLFFDEEPIYKCMKFQNPNLNFERAHRQMHRHMDKPKPNMPLQLFQSWGHKKTQTHNRMNGTAVL